MLLGTTMMSTARKLNKFSTSSLQLAYVEFTFKGEWAYDIGMPQ